MNKLNVIGILASLCFLNCQHTESNSQDVQSIVDQSIAISGGKFIDSSSIAFSFRDRDYLAKRNKGDFFYARITTNDGDSIFDIINNEGFERFINDEIVEVADSMAIKYTSSVNSVHYFSILPYGLNDLAVNKKYIGTKQIKNKAYHKVEVTFNKDGGGEDYEDVFMYWMDTKTFKVDYLAYSYAEDDGVGLRFREAYNERYFKGIRFVDYNNYKPKSKISTLIELDSLFEINQLKLLSKIELKNIMVNQ